MMKRIISNHKPIECAINSIERYTSQKQKKSRLNTVTKYANKRSLEQQ